MATNFYSVELVSTNYFLEIFINALNQEDSGFAEGLHVCWDAPSVTPAGSLQLRLRHQFLLVQCLRFIYKGETRAFSGLLGHKYVFAMSMAFQIPEDSRSTI